MRKRSPSPIRDAPLFATSTRDAGLKIHRPHPHCTGRAKHRKEGCKLNTGGGAKPVAKDGSVTGFGPLEHTSGARCVLVGAKVVLVGATEQRVVVKVTRTDGEMYESSESDQGAMGTACLSDKVTTRFLVLPRALSKEPVKQIRHVLTLPAPGALDDLPNTVFPKLGGTLTSASKELRVKACGKTLSLPL